MAGKITVSTINDSSGVLATQNGMTGIAKAWVSFAGASGTINGSFNVSSVTRTGTGIYVINFTTAMVNTSYAYSATASRGSSWVLISANTTTGASNLSPTTSAFGIATPLYDASNYTDPTTVYAVVFGA